MEKDQEEDDGSNVVPSDRIPTLKTKNTGRRREETKQQKATRNHTFKKTTNTKTIGKRFEAPKGKEKKYIGVALIKNKQPSENKLKVLFPVWLKQTQKRQSKKVSADNVRPGYCSGKEPECSTWDKHLPSEEEKETHNFVQIERRSLQQMENTHWSKLTSQLKSPQNNNRKEKQTRSNLEFHLDSLGSSSTACGDTHKEPPASTESN